MQDRIKRVIKNIPLQFLALVFFLYILYFIHIRIPCAFKTITHLDCPSCGVSRMCVSLSHGDIRSAFYYNQILVFLFPLIVIYYIFYQLRYIKTGQRKISKLENNIMIVIIVILLIYGVIRNCLFIRIATIKSRENPDFFIFHRL